MLLIGVRIERYPRVSLFTVLGKLADNTQNLSSEPWTRSRSVFSRNAKAPTTNRR